MTTATAITCDARTGYQPRALGWGFVPIYCAQRVGLHPFRDAAGHTRHHCGRDGHQASAERRYGVWEPEQVEAELRAAWGDR
jgi:hypothetical protein